MWFLNANKNTFKQRNLTGPIFLDVLTPVDLFVAACSSLNIGLNLVEPLYIHSVLLSISKNTCTNEQSTSTTIQSHHLPKRNV